jgi:hypothetical protein
MLADIQPIQIWNAGQVQTATKFSLVTVYDDLDTYATTYYQLLTSDSVQLSQGNQQIEGQEYQDWNNDPDANAWILNWSATQLGITII